MGGMAGVGVAPPPNHPPTSLAGGSTRARHPGPSIARARCGGKRYPGCLSVPLPPKSPDPPPPTIPSKPPRPSSPGTTMLGKAHSRARAAAAAALARLIARAVCGGYGGGGGRLHRPSRALRAPCVTRVYAYVVTAHRARHHRFRSPVQDRHARAAAAAALARLCARRRRRWGWGWRSVTPRVTRVTRARVHVITAHRVRHHRSSSPTRPHACAATAAALARSIARAVCGGCGGGGGRWRGRAVTSPVTRVTRAVHHARVRVRHHRASCASSPFSVPPAHDRHAARAAAAAALARSLARAEAEAVGLGVAFSYTARHARHARARERHHRASRASSPFFVPPVHDRHARAAAAAALARSLDCARGVWRW